MKRLRTVYAYDVWDLRTGELAPQAYVGKTVNMKRRDHEHRYGTETVPAKVWAGQIYGDMYPLWQAECGRFRAWFMEIFYILTKEPLFNVEWNKRNPHRIPPWTARELYGPPRAAYGGPRVDVRTTR